MAAIDPFDPEAAEKKRLLKEEYDRKLKLLISGDKDEKKIEDTFFAERPEPETITKESTFNKLEPATTNKKYICRVYFALSPYNKLDDIAYFKLPNSSDPEKKHPYAQVTVKSQLTNRNVLQPNKYLSGVALKEIFTDLDRVTDDKYYIEIKPEDLKDCNFNVDQYYKVQIRFETTDVETPNVD